MGYLEILMTRYVAHQSSYYCRGSAQCVQVHWTGRAWTIRALASHFTPSLDSCPNARREGRREVCEGRTSALLAWPQHEEDPLREILDEILDDEILDYIRTVPAPADLAVWRSRLA
jgi:hypothetical protein